MTAEGLSEIRRHRGWVIFERVGVTIALVASLATVIGLFLQARTEKRLIEIQVLSTDQLTRLPQVGGLEGEFTFNGISVTDLWRIRLRFANTGDTTLVGHGSSSALLDDSILIEFPNDIDILDPADASDSFYSLSRRSSNSMELTFSQWRPEETFELVAHLASDTVLDSSPFPLVSGRPIIDGEVLVRDLTIMAQDNPQPLIEYLPAQLALSGKVLAGLLAALVGLAAFILLDIVAPFDYLRTWRWRTRYQDEFIDFLDENITDEKEKQRIIERPWTLDYLSFPYPIYMEHERYEAIAAIAGPPEAIGAEESADPQVDAEAEPLPKDRQVLAKKESKWAGFAGPRARNPAFFESFWGTLLGAVIGLLITAACLAIIASIITV